MSARFLPSDLLSFTNPAGLYDPRPNGYSHVATVHGPARMVFISGQGGEDADGRLAQGFDAQLERALDNLGVALRAADAQWSDVARLTVLVVDHSEARLRALTAALARRWADTPAPACTLVGSASPALDGMLVEKARLRVLTAALARQRAGAAMPACTLIPVPRLALDGMLVEIDAVAALPAAPAQRPRVN